MHMAERSDSPSLHAPSDLSNRKHALTPAICEKAPLAAQPFSAPHCAIGVPNIRDTVWGSPEPYFMNYPIVKRESWYSPSHQADDFTTLEVSGATVDGHIKNA